MKSITIVQPDDWHVHLRDGDMLQRVAPYTASQFGRAMIMPNLSPPVTNVSRALEYRQRILNGVSSESGFQPKMSIYLTDNTSQTDVAQAAEHPDIVGFKLYPAGATTNSASGVSRISGLMEVLESMADTDLVLQVHGEVTDNHVDIFDRESVFIEQVLSPLAKELPELKIILEHVTTKEGVQFVEQGGGNIAATITPQHLMFNRNEIFREGIRPHLYCLPVLKREGHRQALVEAATGGNRQFFLGTDSAPHSKASKQSSCGCAGIFSANAAIELYAAVFDELERIHQLEGFSSIYGAEFYGLPHNSKKVTLTKETQIIPDNIPDITGLEGEELIPLLAGEAISWKLQPNT